MNAYKKRLPNKTLCQSELLKFEKVNFALLID